MNANTTTSPTTITVPEFSVNLAQLDDDVRQDLKNWMGSELDEMAWNTWTENEIIFNAESVLMRFAGGSDYEITFRDNVRSVMAVDSYDLADAVLDMIEHAGEMTRGDE